MASTTILSDNGVSSGSAGLKETGGNDGVLILQTTTSGGTATNAVYVDNTQKVGFGATPGTARITIAAANAVTASRGTAYLYTTDSMAANLGGQISFGGSYTGTSETIFGAVAGRKENGTGADISGYLQLSTTNAGLGLVERARIDSSGYLGIGTTSPQAFLHVAPTSGLTPQIKLGAASSYQLQIGYNNSAEYGFLQAYAANLSTPDDIVINPSGGNLLVGTTSATAKVAIVGVNALDSAYALAVYNSTPSVLFSLRNDGYAFLPTTYAKTVGSAANMFISSDGSLYRSTSSLKYKTNVQDAEHGLAELLALRPITYQGKVEATTEATFGGLIAEEVHEAGLTEFVQYAEDGTPDALAYGPMVSLCIKAIQEQQALITTLTERITALEAK